MRVYPYDRAENGEYVDPYPLNRELRNVIERANHLDRWAFAGDLPVLRFTATAFGEFGRWIETVSQTVTVAAATYTESNTNYPSVQTVPIPNNAGDPWVEQYDTSDGLAVVRLMLDMTTDENGNCVYRPGVRVNGINVVGPQVTGRRAGDSLLIHGTVPIGAGTVTLAPFLYVWNSGVDADLTFNTRTLAIRTAAR